MRCTERSMIVNLLLPLFLYSISTLLTTSSMPEVTLLILPSFHCPQLKSLSYMIAISPTAALRFV